MEKETKRAIQNILQIMGEQQEAIRNLRKNVKSSRPDSDDGLSNRIQRIADQVSERESFEVDWARLCDRHYAKRS